MYAGKRKRGANLRAPHGARSCLHFGNVVHLGEVLARPDGECHSQNAAAAFCDLGPLTEGATQARTRHPVVQAAIAFWKTRSPGVPFSKVRMAR